MNDHEPKSRPGGSPAPESQAPTSGSQHAEPPHRGVAFLLTAAAVVAALLGGRASILSADSATAWQQGTREKVRQAAGYVESIRYIYDVEVPRAFLLTEMRFRVEELSNIPRADKLSPNTRRSIEVAKESQQDVLDQLGPASILATDADYRTETGFDPALMLADERRDSPVSVIAVDPEATKEKGTEIAGDAILMMSTTVFVGLAFLCGSLARGFPRRRREWLASGVVFLSAGVLAAIAIEVL